MPQMQKMVAAERVWLKLLEVQKEREHQILLLNLWIEERKETEEAGERGAKPLLKLRKKLTEDTWNNQKLRREFM